jgi:hypothetical protein
VIVQVELSQNQMNRMAEKHRDSASFHRFLVITLQILTVVISLPKSALEDYKLRKVPIC